VVLHTPISSIGVRWLGMEKEKFGFEAQDLANSSLD